MRLERRTQSSLALLLAAPIIAIVIALALSGGLIALAGVNPLDAYAAMVKGAFGSRLSISETLTRTTPLILTGLAAAVAFRARLWNIGGEGQLYAGALVAAWLGHNMAARLPTPLAIILIMLAGMLAGALLLLGPVLLRLRLGVDEVVTTLILNFIVLLFVSMMIEGPLKDPLAFGWPQSVPVDSDVMLPKLLSRSRLHIGLIIAILAAFVIWIVQSRTVFGMETKAAGLNTKAASFAGIKLGRTLLGVACISGGMAGLAGAIEVTGLKGYVTLDLSPGYGYSGIVVAMLAALHPVGVVITALFVAIVFVGADAMSRALGVPSFIADVIVSISLLTMLVSLLFTTYRVRR
ncbi:MAG: ABC transporter permease [Rhizobiaceae bacterium]|nr:ABC transporter permease [Rhizobiaceae bacterium]